MSLHRLLPLSLVGLLLLTTAARVEAVDVLTHVPEDALGFVLVRDLARVDADAERLLTTFAVTSPSPVAFLRAATGVGDGLDLRGDFLLALLPNQQAADRPVFAVWLPMDDYTQFVNSLQGTTTDRITAVTIAGEDLLVAEHGEWALVMDPDQREQMVQIIAERPPASHGLDPWSQWIEANSVTAVLLPAGIRAVVAWVVDGDDGNGEAQTADGPEDRFGQDDPSLEPFEADESGSVDASDPRSALRATVRRVLSDRSELAQWALQSNAIALGGKLDDRGNAIAGVRWAWRPDIDEDAETADRAPALPMPPALFSGGPFIVSGGGQFPESIAVRAAEIYARLLVHGVEAENQAEVDDRAAARFVAAARRAVAGVGAASVLSRPGTKDEGVYTNNFLLVRVDSADAFQDRARELVRLWNELNHDAGGEIRLVFDVESIEIGGSQAIEFSINMAALLGSPEVPEIRHAMERLFGPQGRFRLLSVGVDDHTVLLAMATREQAAAVLPATAAERTDPGRLPELADANALLPAEADWRLFVSPHGYNRWLKRQMDAMLGPVLGGPIVREFPPSPPVGLAGGFKSDELWFDVALPAATIDSAARHLNQR